jgi:tRNA(Ile)-lysidine synthase
MLYEFQNHLSKKFSFLNEKKLLLAISGGLDSMVLLHLFQQLKYKIAFAHCNFQLRGLESFEDQKFVQEYAETHKIEAFITQFDTKNFASDYKLSTQVAARELRYNWFYELLETKNFDYILTAHHADDNLETFIINLSRGTGIDGLVGIPIQNDKIIRPLLIFSRNEIEIYAKENDIVWREDSSNASDTYLRNKIRHHLVPVLKELNTNFVDAFQKTQQYLQESQTMVEDAAIMVYQQVAKTVNEDIHFDIIKLKTLPNYKSYLHHWLREFGFTAWYDIYNLVDSQTGKIIYSNDYQLLKNRNQLIVSPKDKLEKQEYFIDKNTNEVKIPLKLAICHVTDISQSNENSIFVDENKLKFPLTIRKWCEGDIFLPFGMNGKSKKVSKFFKDEKFSLLEKQNTWLLCSENQIVWVIGKRQDERFKIEKTTQKIIQITLFQ